MKKQKANPKAYFVGGGIASLSGAVFLIKDGAFSGDKITIFEKSRMMGGSLDGQNPSLKKHYSTRGFRILERKIYLCAFDVFSSIPSLKNPDKTILDEFLEFNKKIKTYAKTRLIKNGKNINAKPLKLSFNNRIKLIRLVLRPEISLDNIEIDDYFEPSFFKSNFWFEFCTIFSFQPWHSLAEFRRYLIRVAHDLPVLDTVKTMMSMPYNQYDSIVLPVLAWLKKQGVNFETNCEVTDLGFESKGKKKIVNRIDYKRDNKKEKISVAKNDYVFITLGSIVENSSIGSMENPPSLNPKQTSPSWKLWEKISKESPNFGKPSVFNKRINRSKWISFTITFRGRHFLNLIEKITKREIGTEGPITFHNSNWLFSIGIPHQPYFIDQPRNVAVCWGYGLYPDKKGNYINKKMSDCNGKEILIELCHHLGFQKKIQKILDSSTCVPCVLPYITSHFFTRKKGDRPRIVPKESLNFAFLGQYCEIPNEIVFTMEYSIRSAQIAIYELLKLNKKIPPIYKGYRDFRVSSKILKTIFR